MYLDSSKEFILIGCVGGLYAIISGLAISLTGVTMRGNILLFIGISNIFPALTIEFFTYFSTVFPFISLITLGPFAGYFSGIVIGDLNTFGIIVSVHGFIILLSAIGTWMGNRWYAAILTLFGLIGTFAFFNLGGVLGLLSGVILWYHLK